MGFCDIFLDLPTRSSSGNKNSDYSKMLRIHRIWLYYSVVDCKFFNRITA
jgi:hypothetical protein